MRKLYVIVSLFLILIIILFIGQSCSVKEGYSPCMINDTKRISGSFTTKQCQDYCSNINNRKIEIAEVISNIYYNIGKPNRPNRGIYFNLDRIEGLKLLKQAGKISSFSRNSTNNSYTLTVYHYRNYTKIGRINVICFDQREGRIHGRLIPYKKKNYFKVGDILSYKPITPNIKTVLVPRTIKKGRYFKLNNLQELKNMVGNNIHNKRFVIKQYRNNNMINQGMIIIWVGGVNGLHGRYDPYGRSKPNDWKIGDVISLRELSKDKLLNENEKYGCKYSISDSNLVGNNRGECLISYGSQQNTGDLNCKNYKVYKNDKY